MTLHPHKPRVAVVGASGIGKHHANWWTIEGAEVCAIAGTSNPSVLKTAGMLHEMFGFDGRGYDSCEAMLERESPDIVDICSPPALHYGHCKKALQAGCHVLCEKPFVYDAALSRGDLLGQARELMELAAAAGMRIGVCTQYTCGARLIRTLRREQDRNERLTDFVGHLESPARGRAPDPARVWVDLSPHPISLLLEFVPGFVVNWESLETDFDGFEATARFQALDASGSTVQCTIQTRNTVEPPRNVRRCVLNGEEFLIEGTNDDSGVYRSRIRWPDGSVVETDLMHLAIREFLQGRPPADEETSLANLDIMLRVLESTTG